MIEDNYNKQNYIFFYKELYCVLIQSLLCLGIFENYKREKYWEVGNWVSLNVNYQRFGVKKFSMFIINN